MNYHFVNHRLLQLSCRTDHVTFTFSSEKKISQDKSSDVAYLILAHIFSTAL